MKIPALVEFVCLNGVLICSGSRSVTSYNWAESAFCLASQRGWAIAVGDAAGVDECVIATWARHAAARHFRTIERLPHLVIMGCETIGHIRATVPKHEMVQTWLVPGGTPKSCFIIRDQALAELGTLSRKAGFMGLWDGQSKGVIKTMEFCKQVNIPGVLDLYNPETKTWQRSSWQKVQVAS